jgi:hypothetical protein
MDKPKQSMTPAGGNKVSNNEAFQKAKAKAIEFLKTPMGKTVATGALAGGAIGAALPFVSAIAGAAVGAGSLVLIKSIRDKL